jgi:hypothetical protein
MMRSNLGAKTAGLQFASLDPVGQCKNVKE